MPALAARSVPFGTLTPSSTAKSLANGPLRLRGWAFKETTGTGTAEVDVYDGEGSGGQLLAQVTLTASQSNREWFTDGGLDIEHGVALVVTSGSVSGSVWVLYPYGEVPGEGS